VSAILKVAETADRLGFRSLVARAASLAYAPQHFEVDREGHWVNRQAEATFVSPTLHTANFSEVERAVLDNWTWGYLPKPGDIVVDVGAGIGEEAVVFSRRVGSSGRVIAIEAHPETFACLRETIERSGLDNVTALNCAVADRDGELFISAGPTHLGPSHLMNTVLNGGSGTRVSARTLDSLADELALDHIDLLKMNIEGAEKMAVEGFDRLAPNVRHAAISCHDFVATHFGGAPHYVTKERVCAALEARGFAIRSRPDAADSWVRDYLYASR
jgi:FkbM family methyltransferase